MSRGRLLPRFLSSEMKCIKFHLVRRWPSKTHSRKLPARKHRETQSQKSCRLKVLLCQFIPYRTKRKIFSREKRTICKNIDKRSLKTCKSPRDQNVPNGLWCWQAVSCYVSREKLNWPKRCFESTPPWFRSRSTLVERNDHGVLNASPS